MNKALSKSVKMLMAGMAIAALSASVYARGGDCDYGYGPGPGYGMHGGRMNTERMERMHEQNLAALHDKLKLTAQQETAWKKFAAIKPIADPGLRPDPAEMDKLNAPQRLEKGLEHMRAMEARMTEHLAALKEFYAVLKPEQQKIFDEHSPWSGGRWDKRGK